MTSFFVIGKRAAIAYIADNKPTSQSILAAILSSFLCCVNDSMRNALLRLIHYSLSPARCCGDQPIVPGALPRAARQLRDVLIESLCRQFQTFHLHEVGE